MSKKLIRIEFAFENCEVVEIDSKYIGNFFIDDLKSKLYKHYTYTKKATYCKHFSMLICGDADVEYYPFELEYEEFKTTKLKRFESVTSIVSISIYYDDETNEEIYLDWLGDSDYTNEAQRLYRNSQGDMLIIVDKKNDNDEFYINKLNDIKSMQLMWEFNK